MGESRDVWMMDGYKIISIPHNKVVEVANSFYRWEKWHSKRLSAKVTHDQQQHGVQTSLCCLIDFSLYTWLSHYLYVYSINSFKNKQKAPLLTPSYLPASTSPFPFPIKLPGMVNFSCLHCFSFLLNPFLIGDYLHPRWHYKCSCEGHNDFRIANSVLYSHFTWPLNSGQHNWPFLILKMHSW